jgi:hypothetical protein
MRQPPRSSGKTGVLGPLPPAAVAAPRSSSPWQKLQGDRGFCTVAAPAWAPPYAQVPRPEHIRRGNDDAAPSSCERYPIRCFLLTDSVVYAPCPACWCKLRARLRRSSDPSARHSARMSLPTGHPPAPTVLHRRGARAPTAGRVEPSTASHRFHLLNCHKCANNVLVAGTCLLLCPNGTVRRRKLPLDRNDRTKRDRNIGKKGRSVKHVSA